MSTLRRDRILDEWRVVAEERARRPNEYTTAGAIPEARACPFCEGHERQTPPEIAARRLPGTAPDGPGWRVRVVPNLHPAVRPDVPFEPPAPGAAPPDVLPGFGRHEVIIASPRHVPSLSDLSVPHLAEVLAVTAERMRDAMGDVRLRTISVFHNRGGRAGASLSHVHAQLLALPVPLPRPEAELEAARKAAACGDPCPWCALLHAERDAGERMVRARGPIAVLCPLASRAPYETWLLPEAHEPDFAALPARTLETVAAVLRAVLTALEAELPDASYNLALHGAPPRAAGRENAHWRIEVIPRVTRLGGFEWATGSTIDPVTPEHAADALRSRLGRSPPEVT